MTKGPGFDILAIVTAGDGSKRWVEVRVKIEQGFDFTSEKDVGRLVRSLRSASKLMFGEEVEQ